MQETKGLLDQIKQHDKLAIRVSSNSNNNFFEPQNIGVKILIPIISLKMFCKGTFGQKIKAKVPLETF